MTPEPVAPASAPLASPQPMPMPVPFPTPSAAPPPVPPWPLPETVTQTATQAVQGEGDYAATHRYRDSVEAFVASGQVADAARNAPPKSVEQEADLIAAERIGESHSKGEDPASRHAPPRAA